MSSCLHLRRPELLLQVGSMPVMQQHRWHCNMCHARCWACKVLCMQGVKINCDGHSCATLAITSCTTAIQTFKRAYEMQLTLTATPRAMLMHHPSCRSRTPLIFSMLCCGAQLLTAAYNVVNPNPDHATSFGPGISFVPKFNPKLQANHPYKACPGPSRSSLSPSTCFCAQFCTALRKQKQNSIVHIAS